MFLTVFQMLPVDGIITRFRTPVSLLQVVGKAVNLAHDLDIPVAASFILVRTWRTSS